MKKHVICNDCLFRGLKNETCIKCIPETKRSNFISLYRKNNDSEIYIKPQSNPVYKVLYKNPETGDWFYETNTPDQIGHYPNLLVEDILDI